MDKRRALAGLQVPSTLAVAGVVTRAIVVVVVIAKLALDLLHQPSSSTVGGGASFGSSSRSLILHVPPLLRLLGRLLQHYQ